MVTPDNPRWDAKALSATTREVINGINIVNEKFGFTIFDLSGTRLDAIWDSKPIFLESSVGLLSIFGPQRLCHQRPLSEINRMIGANPAIFFAVTSEGAGSDRIYREKIIELGEEFAERGMIYTPGQITHTWFFPTQRPFVLI